MCAVGVVIVKWAPFSKGILAPRCSPLLQDKVSTLPCLEKRWLCGCMCKTVSKSPSKYRIASVDEIFQQSLEVSSRLLQNSFLGSHTYNFHLRASRRGASERKTGASHVIVLHDSRQPGPQIDTPLASLLGKLIENVWDSRPAGSAGYTFTEEGRHSGGLGVAEFANVVRTC